MTATTSRNAFIYGMTESFGETAVAATLTAARYAVLAYDLVTSEEARQTYRWVKEMTVALGQLAFWSAVWAWAKVQQWAEAEVQGCLPDHVVDANEMVEADPFSPEANPHYPVTDYRALTTTELRKACQAAGIRWRNARGKGRHMAKEEMIAALA